MKVTVKNLSELTPMEKNIRRHSQKQIAEYVRSLKMFGQVKPLVVDESGVILIGNGLFEALRTMGAERADCYVMTGMSEVEKKKLMLADNRVYELGMTDTDVFDEIIKSLDGDIDVPGWDADLLETLNATIHEVNDMVDNYGAYAPEDMQQVNSRQEAITGELQQPSGTMHAAEQVNTASDAQEPTAPNSGSETRTVICPKCGEVIQIGGM